MVVISLYTEFLKSLVAFSKKVGYVPRAPTVSLLKYYLLHTLYCCSTCRQQSRVISSFSLHHGFSLISGCFHAYSRIYDISFGWIMCIKSNIHSSVTSAMSNAMTSAIFFFFFFYGVFEFRNKKLNDPVGNVLNRN